MSLYYSLAYARIREIESMSKSTTHLLSPSIRDVLGGVDRLVSPIKLKLNACNELI